MANHMATALVISVCALSLVARAQDEAPSLPPVSAPILAQNSRTISTSGQFLVWSPDQEARSAFADRCEEIREDFNAVMRLPDRWSSNIIVNLRHEHTGPGPVERHAASRDYLLKGGGHRYDVYVLLDENYQSAEFERELVKVLMLERMSAPHQGPTLNRIPTWLLVGIDELVRYRRAGRPSDIFKSLIDAKQIMPIREVMLANPDLLADSLSRRIYHACAAALVQSLIDQGRGDLRMRAFLEDLAIEDAPFEELLKRHFPALRKDADSLEKWWLLQMAAMSERNAMEYLTIVETDQFLEQSLLVHFQITAADEESEPVAAPALAGSESELEPATAVAGVGMSLLERIRTLANSRKRDSAGAGAEPGAPAPNPAEFASGTVRDFEQFFGRADAKLTLSVNREQLQRLRARAFPLYRPILVGYDYVLGNLISGDTRDAAAQLAELDRQRGELQRIMTGVSDYMNWFETTQITEHSDAFRSYDEALERIRKLDAERRSDPVSRYLDAIEREVEP